MINIGFILPSSDYLHDPFKGDPHTHLQILTLLEDRFNGRVKPSMIDLRGVQKEFAYRKIDENDLFFYSVYTLDYPEQISIMQQIRGMYPKAKHIAGGSHVEAFVGQCRNTFSSVVTGECEDTLEEIITDFENGKLKDLYRQKKPVDINSFSIPRRHFLPKATTMRKGMMGLKRNPFKECFDEKYGTTAIFSRGCPYRCSFCTMPSTKSISPGVRFRSPENVTKEIEYLKKNYGIGCLNLLDEIGIPLSKEDAISHLEAIGKTDIAWRGQCRVDALNTDVVKLMKQSGCMAMGFGIESVYPESLKAIRKNIDLDKAKKTVSLLHNNHIEVSLYMICGLPHEDKNYVDKTWNFIKEVNPERVVLSLLAVRPGTELYNRQENYGIQIVSGDWSKTRHMYGRYNDEKPVMNFHYKPEMNRSQDEIIRDYTELQGRLREAGLST